MRVRTPAENTNTVQKALLPQNWNALLMAGTEATLHLGKGIAIAQLRQLSCS